MLEAVLAQQTQAFLHAAVLGLVLGFLYDVLAFFRRLGGGGAFLTALLDLFFCLMGSAGFFLLVFGESRGVIRGYLPLGAILGGALYAALCSPTVRRMLWKIQGFFAFFRRKSGDFQRKHRRRSK